MIHPILSIKHAYQRAKRGYSDHDAWDFYTWHAEVIANIADDYLKRHWSHPCGIAYLGNELKQIEMKRGGKAWVCDCACDEMWTAVLTTIRDGYRLIAEGEDEEDDFVTIKPIVKEAEKLFHEHYRSFWL